MPPQLKVLASRPMRKIEMRVTRGVTSNMISAKTEHIGTYRRCCDIVSEILPEPVRNAIRAALDFEVYQIIFRPIISVPPSRGHQNDTCIRNAQKISYMYIF